MDYPVGPEQAEREDTLLQMLSDDQLAVAARQSHPAIYLRQAFMTAAKAFQAFDSRTQGLIVPYTPIGKAVIAALCAAHEPDIRTLSSGVVHFEQQPIVIFCL
jgi:CRISPR-associated endonuclease/helicase Cas3